jgi:3-deoxy-7-phosphoheptulonate synthase
VDGRPVERRAPGCGRFRSGSREPLPLRLAAAHDMPHRTDDLRIREIKELAPPAHLIREFPCTEKAADTVYAARQTIHRILHGMDDRLLVVIGPCSIHDPRAAREYARRLVAERQRHGADLEIVMRVYFEKPRTTVGWKGLINDPELDGSCQINRGLRLARELLLDIAELGLPAGCEYLDMITPQYVADLVSWGAIGARTTESQVHRELASGLSCPVGFKNGTDGNVRIAIDAIKAAQQPHHFLSVTKGGHSAIVSTNGNEDCHVILRGGKAPNFGAASVEAACQEAARAGLAQRLMIDASHANAAKKAENQVAVCEDVAGQVARGDARIVGVMVESHLVAGRQDLAPGRPLTYGQSITDPCLGWEDSVAVLDALAAAARERRLEASRRDEAEGER